MIKQDNSYRLDRIIILILILAIMLLACDAAGVGEPAITGARSAAKTCATRWSPPMQSWNRLAGLVASMATGLRLARSTTA